MNKPLPSTVLAAGEPSAAKGLFAGISLKGASLRPDTKENASLYGHEMTSKEILAGNMKAPDGAHDLIANLNKYAASSSADRSKQ